MKSILKCFFTIIVVFSFCSIIKADLHDYSGGGSGNTGSLGSGSWSTQYVGIKVSIINNSNKVEDVEIFLNSTGKGSTNFSYENLPKTHQSTNITWTAASNRTTYTATFLPDYWKDGNGTTINLYNILTNDNYKNLKTIIQHSSLSGNVGTGDYIYVEPMVKIGSYYGTAFEMTNAFLDNSKCGTSGSFCWSYTGAVFGGINSDKRGVLYNTLYVSSGINGVYASDPSSRNDRNNCLKSNTCGRGIGVFKYDDIYPQGKVKITIYNNLTKKTITNPNSQATYKIYKGKDCTGTVAKNSITTSSGSKIVDLAPGTYSIQEVTHPSGYVASKNKCVKNNISISVGKTTNADIYYDPTCQTALDESDKSVTSLMNLYNKFQVRGLLNFSSPSCKAKKEDLCNENKLNNSNLGCLTGMSSLITQFDQNNLSCYDEKITSDDGSIGFCSTNFSLTNNLGTNTFTANAGQFLIKKDSLESIATAQTTRTCYVYNKSIYSLYKDIKTNEVSFGDNNQDKVADKLERYEEKETQNSTTEANDYFRKYVYEKTKNYYLNPVYLERLTGKYSIRKSITTTKEPIYGILARFKNDSTYIPFKLTYDNKDYKSEECTYKTTEEIITYNKKENGQLDLEYRIIDTKNPFDRDTNSNWCEVFEDGTYDCSKDNNLVITYIKNATNSYGIKNGVVQEPIYKITLTPNDIRIIREFNKDNKYDNYQLYCENLDTCRNAFVYDLINGNLNKYKLDSQNKSIVEKTYGTLKYKMKVLDS